MADHMSPEALKSVLEGQTQFAFIDIREAGEYNTSHIPGASLLSRRQLESQMLLAVPHQDTHVILCDDDGRRAPLAAATVERMGYRHVSVLDGGINRWVSQNYPTEWGSNVPSKDLAKRWKS
jgi:cystathionine beta-lyase